MGRGSGCGKTHARQICRELGRRHGHDIHCKWEQGGEDGNRVHQVPSNFDSCEFIK